MIYLDHAATSFPKAPGVAEEAARFLREDAGNPGRGGHALARRAQDGVERARVTLARLLKVEAADRLVLVSGTTEALNVAIRGLASEGGRVLVGPEAHNSVLRPLALLAEERGVRVEEVRADDVLRWDLDDLARRLCEGPAGLVVVGHGSNVTGAVQDLAGIGRLAGEVGAPVLVDAAQTAGALPLALAGLDAVAFSGHKALLGPTGTGGLYLRPGLDLPPLLVGGTGSGSEDERPPRALPGALEAGTRNAFAFSALAVAAGWVLEQTPAALHGAAAALGARLREGLAAVPGVRVHAAGAPGDLAVVSFTVAGWDPQEVALALDASAGIAVRAGLHCAPRAHRRLGTLAGGTVRASAGPLLPQGDVECFLERVAALAG